MITSKLWEKSQASGDILERSGTLFSSGTPEKRKFALQDAENRLRTGGGLFGKNAEDSALSFSTDKLKRNNTQGAAVGLPINSYLRKGSIETINFMPLLSVDAFSGIIITDWYTSENQPSERCKLNIFVKGIEMKTENLQVNSFCQKMTDSGNWVDVPVNKENNSKLENAILNKAKKIRLAQS